jgi:hypothetical protein
MRESLVKVKSYQRLKSSENISFEEDFAIVELEK